MNLRPRVVRLILGVIALAIATSAGAQHGRFDQTPVNPIDEAHIFTPPGFEREGKVAVAEGEGAALLNVTVIDGATGKPTACRVNVVGPDGNFYQPKENALAAFSLNGKWPDTLAGNRPAKAPIRYFGHFFYTTGSFSVAVPAGKSRIEVWKGLEYRPIATSVQVGAGKSQDVKVSLARTAPMASQGWYSGDPHLHFIRSSDADEKTIFDLLEAEDVRLGMVLAYNENTSLYPGVMPEMATPQLRGLGSKSIRRRGDYQIISGQEYRNGVFGHLNLYLRDSLVFEQMKFDPNVGPVFGRIGVETRELGGYAFHAHGGYGLEIWADLVQGATSGVELLQFGIYRGIGLDGWYHVLNAGFRFPGIAACDYPACRKLADCRTYVHLDGEPNFKDWLAGAAAGRSFMTTGPLLLLEVDGKLPGDTIVTDDAKPKSVKVRLRVLSEAAPVTDVQIIAGGRVVHETKAVPKAGEGQQILVETEVPLTESSWIAARAFSQSPTGSADAESHTNPVYVQLAGKAPYHQADLDWLVERLDEQIADHEARKAPEKAVPIEYFRRSRELLVERRARGGQPDATAAAKNAEPKGLVPGDPTDQSLAEFLKPTPALAPAEAVKAFETQKGFRMELVASEPDVCDPVAACFDENGGMYVAEMIDYPYRPKEGQEPLGRVRYLEDADGDGKFEKSWIFADKIVWPTGVVCWKGGVYVSAAPDIWYLKDTNGDHRADVREKVYTGFGDRNQQGGVNNLNWHIDHTIYGSASTNGGEIRPADEPDAKPIVLAGRDFRFDPVTGRFDTVSGRRQFGNAFDDWFNRFLCDESEPGNQVVLPQHYLARNPYLAVPTVMHDLSGSVTPIFRTSPIERWREIRSNRRLASGFRAPTSSGVSHNVIDAAAGLTIYRGNAYPKEYLGQLFVGCSQNNLIHRRTMTPDGATYHSERADSNTEFVRTTDTWFRPVNCINAPDGTIYVLDMSREVIESVHIAHDVVKHFDLNSGRDKGRIYRLAPPGFKVPPQPRLGKATIGELVDTLEHLSGWWRDTASRLIFERQEPAAEGLLRQKLAKTGSPLARLHVLWALEGLHALEDADVLAGLNDSSSGVREHALRLSEPRLKANPALLDKVLSLAGDDDARVRFQTAFTLGATTDPRSIAALAKIAARDPKDYWVRMAVLSSVANRAGELLAALRADDEFLGGKQMQTWFEQLGTLVGARNDAAEVTAALDLAAGLQGGSRALRAILLGLGAGLQRSGSSLETAASGSKTASAIIERAVERAAKTAHDDKAPSDDRQDALRLLGYAGGRKSVDVLLGIFDPRQSESMQIAAAKVLARLSDPRIAAGLVAAWRHATPKVQEEIIGVLVSRQSWAAELLSACQRGDVTPAQVAREPRAALLNHQDASVRAGAEKLFGGASSPRHEVIATYQKALALAGDPDRGDKVYQRECMDCHRLGERGFQVGPNLALTRNRTPAALMEAILDPNREVQPSFVSYVVVDDSGRTMTGLLTSESASSITLAREKGGSETILKANIDEMKSTGKSLMPEGLEKTVDLQNMADLLAFLKQVQYDVGTLPDFVEPAEGAKR